MCVSSVSIHSKTAMAAWGVCCFSGNVCKTRKCRLSSPTNCVCITTEVFSIGAIQTVISATPVSPHRTTTKPCWIILRYATKMHAQSF